MFGFILLFLYIYIYIHIFIYLYIYSYLLNYSTKRQQMQQHRLGCCVYNFYAYAGSHLSPELRNDSCLVSRRESWR